MPYLEILLKKQAELVATSFILGLIFGASYDIISTYHIFCSTLSQKDGKVLPQKGMVPFVHLFFTDLLWTLAAGLVFSLYVYRANDGTFRWFMAASAGCGFRLWRVTAGRLCVRLADRLTRLLRGLIRILLLRPLLWVFGCLRRLACLLWRVTGGRIADVLTKARRMRRTERERRRLAKDIVFTDDGEAGV